MLPAASSARFSQVGAIVFDFDGTLVDTHEAIWGAFDRVMRARGHAPPDEAWVRLRIGRPLKELFVDAAGPFADATLERMVLEYREEFVPLGRRLARALPGTVEVVRHFAPRIPLAIATARTAEGALDLLDSLGLRDGFAAVVGIEQIRDPKPHPETVLLALARVGVPAERAVMVGDTPDDVVAGRRGGLGTVGVASGAHDRAALEAHSPDAVIDRLDELIRRITAAR